MAPTSEGSRKFVDQASSILIEHVELRNQFSLTDDASLRSWAKGFAMNVALYRQVVRTFRQSLPTGAVFTDNSELTEAMVAADKFLLKNVHWTWDESWLDHRWKDAALERKRIWEAEEGRRNRMRNAEESKRVVERAEERGRVTGEPKERYREDTGVEQERCEGSTKESEEFSHRVRQRNSVEILGEELPSVPPRPSILDQEVLLFDYPNDEEWAALIRQSEINVEKSRTWFDPDPVDTSNTLSVSGSTSEARVIPPSRLPQSHQSFNDPASKTADQGLGSISEKKINQRPRRGPSRSSSASMSIPTSTKIGSPRGIRKSNTPLKRRIEKLGPSESNSVTASSSKKPRRAMSDDSDDEHFVDTSLRTRGDSECDNNEDGMRYADAKHTGNGLFSMAPCSWCKKMDSECVRQDKRSSCARCFQSHAKCSLVKTKNPLTSTSAPASTKAKAKGQR